MKYTIALSILFVVCVGALLLLPGPVSVSDLDRCITGGNVNTLCAQTIIRKLLVREDVSMIMRELERSMTPQCHVLGHILGQQVYAKERTMERAYAACGSHECASACVHGAAIAALMSFKSVRDSFQELQHPSLDTIRSKGRELCAERQACHAVGHVLFGLTGTLDQALALCDSLAPNEDSLQACYRGLFMENGNATLTHTENTPPRKHYEDQKDLLYPCDSMEEKYRRACFQVLFMNQKLVLKENRITDPEAILEARIKACKASDEDSLRTECAEGLGYSLYTRGSIEESLNICMSFVARARAACTLGASRAYIDFGAKSDEIASQCAAANESVKKSCYLGLFDATAQRNKGVSSNLCVHVSDPLCDGVQKAYREHPAFPSIE